MTESRHIVPARTHSLDEPTCLVTGATRGIGHAVAIELASRGYKTVIVARNETSAETARAAIATDSGSSNVHALVGDLASQSQIRALASTFRERFGHLDVLVNNAAIFEPTFGETEEGIERHLAVNYLAPFLLTHLLLSSLEAARSGRIVNVSGETARFARIHLADLERRKKFSMVGAYAQSKLAQILFTRTLAERIARTGSRVTVNAMHPGMVATAHLQHGPALLNRFWSGVLPGPKAAVRAIARLCTSPAVANVSGAYYLGRIRFVPPFSAYRRNLREALYEKSLALTGLHADSVDRALRQSGVGAIGAGPHDLVSPSPDSEPGAPSESLSVETSTA